MRRFLSRPIRAAAIAVIVAVTDVSPRAAQGTQPTRTGDQGSLGATQKQEAEALVALVDRAAAGEEPAASGLVWHNDVRKAPEGRIYVPFTVTLPADFSGPIAMYTRVVAGSGRAKPELKPDAKPEAKPGAKPESPEVTPEFAFEDLHFATVPTGVGGRVHRAFAVTPGEYTVFVAVKQVATPPPGHAAQQMLLRQTVSAPDFWGTELMISGVTLAERIQQLPAVLTPEQQLDRPYTVGRTEIIPSFDRAFTKKDVLRITFLIYNPQGDAASKPDVEVDYSFFRKSADGETFFNKTPPQALNEKTLPKEFNLNAGHLLIARQDLPLAQFPEGGYRVEVTVRDRRASASVKGIAPFSLTAPTVIP